MTTSIVQPVFRTRSGKTLLVEPGTENPVPVDEMIRRRNAWHAQYRHLLKGYSVARFLEEKHEDVEKGLE